MKRLRYFFSSIFLLNFVSTTTAQTSSLPYRRYDVEQGMASSDVFSITRDREGVLWFATDNGLSRFDGLQFKNYYTENGLADNMTVAVESFKDTLFISCYRKGIQKFYNNQFDTALFKARLNYFQSHENQLVIAFGANTGFINTITEYKNGHFVNAFRSVIPSPARSGITALYHIENNFIYKNEKLLRQLPKTINPKNITCIDEDTEGGLILGGIGSFGILKTDNSFTEKTIQGLNGTRLFKIVRDKYNRIWCKTKHGRGFL
ncbi:MAG: hypothetical protein HC817_08185 [Saprospiraceae bacterium]|nr:hypothetical protein [Saprospiraceae bacterium]